MRMRSYPGRHGRDEDFWGWRLVTERPVGSQGVVVPPPALDHDLCLLERIEDLTIEQLIPEPGIEALDEAVLPRTARSDLSRLRSDGGDPLLNSFRDEFGAIA